MDELEALPAGDLPTVIPLFAGTVDACATGTAAWNWKPVSSVAV